MRVTRAFATLTCVVVTLGMGSFVGSAAAASAPANDKIGGATDITALPFSQTLDTTHATTDADDAQLNETCGAPATNNSVWYTFTAGPSDTVLTADTTGSDFSSGVIIGTGTPGALTTVACGPLSTRAAVTSGTTYYILAFDDTGSGGTLQISIHGPGPVPPNDRISGATTIGSLPFTDSLDVTGATTGSIDKEANAECGAPRTGNSVWYKFTAAAGDANVLFDASASSYNVGVDIVTGAPGSFSTAACGLFSAVVPTTPGTTYYVMLFDAFGGGGGTLQLNVDHAATIDVGVNRDTHVDAAGVAHVSGTYSCTRAVDPQVEIAGALVEIQGRHVVEGSFDEPLLTANCDGRARPWKVEIAADSEPPFGPGKAAMLTSAIVCDVAACVETDGTQVLKLSHSVPGGAIVAPLTSSSTKVTPRAPHRTYGTTARVAAAWGR